MKKILALALISMIMLTGCSTDKGDPVITDDSSNTTTEDKDKENLTGTWEDNQIEIKGKVLTLPVAVDEFIALGFEFEKEPIGIVQPERTVFETLVDKDGNQIEVQCFNDTKENISIPESKVAGVEISKYSNNDPNDNLDIVLMCGVNFGDSVAQVKEKYGEPIEEDIMQTNTTLYYGEKYEHYMTLSFLKDRLVTIDFYDVRTK